MRPNNKTQRGDTDSTADDNQRAPALPDADVRSSSRIPMRGEHDGQSFVRFGGSLFRIPTHRHSEEDEGEQPRQQYHDMQRDVLAFYSANQSLSDYYVRAFDRCGKKIHHYIRNMLKLASSGELGEAAEKQAQYALVHCLLEPSGMGRSRPVEMQRLNSCIGANRQKLLACSKQFTKLRDRLEMTLTNVAKLEPDIVDKTLQVQQECYRKYSNFKTMDRYLQMKGPGEGDAAVLEKKDKLLHDRHAELKSAAMTCVQEIFCPHLLHSAHKTFTIETDQEKCYETGIVMAKMLQIISLSDDASGESGVATGLGDVMPGDEARSSKQK